jgi:proline dehydrogenase
VAGETAEAALARAADSNARRIAAILNLLGEHFVARGPVREAMREYLRLLDAIDARDLDACISVKPTQLGLLVDPSLCWENVAALVDRVRGMDGFLWIDMENAHTTSATLAVYERALARYPRVGVAVQANLRRTEADVTRLLPLGAKFRLCKGAYRETAAIAYRRRAEVDANYRRLLRRLFAAGDRFAVATHDGDLVAETLRLHRTRPRAFEFQMLLGVREPLKQDLVAKGYRVAEYIPYGANWLPYFLRRLGERPRNVLTMMRSFVSG